MKRINGGSCGGSHPPLNSADSRAPLPPGGALETQLKAFKESGNGQNDLPFVVHEVKTPSLSLSHTPVHTNFNVWSARCQPPNTWKHLEISGNTRGELSLASCPRMDPGWPKSEVFMPARAQGLGAPWWVLALVGCSGIQRPSLMAR